MWDTGQVKYFQDRFLWFLTQESWEYGFMNYLTWGSERSGSNYVSAPGQIQALKISHSNSHFDQDEKLV